MSKHVLKFLPTTKTSRQQEHGVQQGHKNTERTEQGHKGITWTQKEQVTRCVKNVILSPSKAYGNFAL